MSEEGLICRGVRKSYLAGGGRAIVLAGADLIAEPGRFTFILGPSGSGKSTLLSILAGILTPDSGAVRLGGTELFALPRGERIRFRGRMIGVAPQRDHLIPSLTARENAALGLIAQGASRRSALATAEARLTELGLADKLFLKPRALSIGQRQRVALARALAPEPRLLLCDEPTSALDETASLEAMALLRDGGTRSGRAVVIVTHDESLLRPGDAVYRLSGGALQARPEGGAGAGRGAAA